MASISSSHLVDDESPKKPLTRVPAWIPLSVFLGTSFALAIPFVMLRRQRAILQMTLKEGSGPPPRRLAPSHNIRRISASLPAVSSRATSQDTIFTDSDGASPSVTSAFSHFTASSGMLAAKALAIATGIVTVSSIALIWGVKEALGVKDAREFGLRMRDFLSNSIPSLSSAIHRPPVTNDERTGSHHHVSSSDIQDWKWEDAEKRLKLAYEQGGIALWGQTALRELDIEARKERAKRDQEMKNKDRST